MFVTHQTNLMHKNELLVKSTMGQMLSGTFVYTFIFRDAVNMSTITFFTVDLINFLPVADFLELCIIPARFCTDPVVPLQLIRFEKFLKM